MPLPTLLATAKLARKLHKNGAALAATVLATFVTKQMSALKRVLDFNLIEIHDSLDFLKPELQIQNIDQLAHYHK